MHLQHLIPWSDLVSCLHTDSTEIFLPVGDCGRIHIIDKATEIKVASRKFLTQEKICTAKDCVTLPELGVFSKNKISPPILKTRMRSTRSVSAKLKYFKDKFSEAVFEFIATAERKYSDEEMQHFTPLKQPEVIDIRCTECRYQPCQYKCQNFLVFSLFSSNQIEHLLWLNSKGEVSISNALSQLYGGQAVGNGFSFLIKHHLLPFYLTANAIIACGYEVEPEKWGNLAPTGYLRRYIQDDCDYLTFIPSLRPYLHEDVFMRDMKKTKELLSELFRHIYLYMYLKKNFTSYSDERIREDLNQALNYCFNFRSSF